jgi:hypothetical protein
MLMKQHNVTLWVTSANYTTLPPQTYTTPSVTVTPTHTVAPKPVTVISMKTLYTVHMTIPIVSVSSVVKTVMATCTVPRRQATCDPFARISPTLVHAKALQSGVAASVIHPHNVPTPAPAAPKPTAPIANAGGNTPNFGNIGNTQSGWGSFSGWGGSNSNSFMNRFGAWKRRSEREEFVARRHERLSERNLHKRAPDIAVVTVTNSNSAAWKTVTKTWVIPTQTLTVTSTTSVQATITPSPVPVITGQSVAAVVTQTQPVSTKVVVKPTIAYSMTTRIQVFT